MSKFTLNFIYIKIYTKIEILFDFIKAFLNDIISLIPRKFKFLPQNL